jgi:hypothetical protein
MKLFRNPRYAPIRNPRYAPEFLERRLNPAPAGFVAPVSPPVVATVAPVAPDDAVVSPAVDYSLAIADPESFAIVDDSGDPSALDDSCDPSTPANPSNPEPLPGPGGEPPIIFLPLPPVGPVEPA